MLNKTRFASDLEKELARSMRAFGGGKTAQMIKFSKGVAFGLVETIKGKNGKIKPSGSPAGPGKGITGIKEGTLAKQIQSEVNKTFKTRGNKVQKAFMRAMAKSIVKELKKAKITGSSAGPVSKFGGWTVNNMAKKMLQKTGFAKQSTNNKFFKALAKAITNQLKTKGKSNIPRGGSGGGSPNAKIT